MTWYSDWIVLQTLVSLLAPPSYFSVTLALPLKESEEMLTRNPSPNKLRHHGHRHLKQWQLDNIKEDIRRKLSQEDTRVPLLTNTTVDQKRRVLKKYKQSLQDFQWDVHTLYEEEQGSAETYNRFIDDGSRPEKLFTANDSTLQLFFSVNIPQPSDPYKEVVAHSAKLKINIIAAHPERFKRRHHIIKDSVRINLYVVVSDTTSRTVVKSRRLIGSQNVPLTKTGWMEFDVQDTVNEWIENPGSNVGLEIACDRSDENINQIFTFFHANRDFEGDTSVFEDFYPYLAILSQEKEILGRARRQSGDPDCEPGQDKCCRVPVTVNVNEIGYDFIEEPKSFPAFFCSGSCPSGYRQAHKFVPVQLILNRLRPAQVPAPCCSPSEFQDLPYLRYDDQGLLVEKVFEKMIITNCMCT